MTKGARQKVEGKRKEGRGTSGWFLPCAFCLFPLAFAGCQNCELVEADLRCKERQIEELKAEVLRRDCDLRALEVEVEQLQRQCAQPQTGASLVPQKITLGRLTGGVDTEVDCPGDDALQVLLEPRDADGHSIKVPGSVRIECLEVQPNGVKTLLSIWDLAYKDIRRKWETPLMGDAAYRIVLPWQKLPTSEQLRIVVRFVTLDGQSFEADKDVTVKLRARPPRPAARTMLPQAPARVMPRPEPSGPVLAPPPVEPSARPSSRPEEAPPAAEPGRVAPASYGPPASSAVPSWTIMRLPGQGLGKPTASKTTP